MTSPLETGKPPNNTGVMRVIRAFGHSMAGLQSAAKHEAAFRQELALAVVLIPAALFLPVTPVMKLVLVLAMLLVLITELLNSAVEALADHASLAYHDLIKRAKDIGSAAVLLSLLGLAIAWGTALAMAFG